VVDGVKANARAPARRRQQFAPRELAEKVAAALKARADAKGLAAEIAIADDLPQLVVGEPTWLRAALENLIDNAIKFTERGKVRLEVACGVARRGQPRLVFTVQDSGIGLSRDEIKRLFRPFAQAGEHVAIRFGGAGLGLVFVDRLAKAMNGEIAVTRIPGDGSTFKLSVLVKQPEPDAVADPGAPAKRSPKGAAHRLKVLCVEDNPFGRVILNTILTTLGHQVDFVGTGEGAIAIAAGGAHQLVLMDITLPGIDGIEVARRIRALPGAAGKVAIIGISGYGDAASEERARAAGMNGYLAKPVSAAALADVIKQIVE